MGRERRGNGERANEINVTCACDVEMRTRVGIEKTYTY